MDESEVSLALYDKGSGDFTGIATTAAGMLDMNPDTYTKSFQSELCQYDLVVAHIRPSDWNELIAGSDEDTVRLRVSRAGFPGGEQPPHREDGVYVFHLARSTQSLKENPEAWRQIIEGLSDMDTVNNLVAGEGQNQLASFLSRKEFEILPALSILCQGYLAVHAEDHGAGTKVESALDQMGWSDDLIPDEVDVRAKKNEIKDPKKKWWQIFDNAELKNRAEEEWKQDPIGEWDKVEQLINSISTNTDPDPETVAEAYCNLAVRLGGEPCQ